MKYYTQSQPPASSPLNRPAPEDSPDQQHDQGAIETNSRRTSRAVGSTAKARTGRKSLPSEGEFRYQVDQHGRQHFNFRQEIWIDEAVPMAYTPVYTMALKTLAVNLLTLTLNVRNVRVAIGSTSRIALSLAPAFSKQCLLGAPSGAWILPKATIEDWLQYARRRQSKRRPR